VDKFIVHNANIDGPATHVAIIGVGDYPHLLDGSGEKTDHHDGMSQLTSPPVSARHLADWFITKYHNPDKPLGTVTLLCSESIELKYSNPVSNIDYTIAKATLKNVKTALRAWKKHCDKNEENITFFFYCGHGISQGQDMALLMSDYGEDNDNPFDGAIDFKTFQERMKRNCLATHQIYIVDACRVSTDTLIETFGEVGDTILSGPGTESAISTIFYSTLAGAKAYGKKDKPSSFTTMLLKALNGGGAHDQNNDWRISTTRLKEAIDLFMKRAADDERQKVQTPPTDGLVTYDIHFLKGIPSVEVRVQCNPAEANNRAKLLLKTSDNKEKKQRKELSEQPWDVEVQVGEYIFSATFDDNQFNNQNHKKYVTPPSPLINLNVQ
jgi:hypothetical protein